MTFKLLRLFALVTFTGFLMVAKTEPVSAEVCCEECVDLVNEYLVNCIADGEFVDSEYCNSLEDVRDFCVNVCTVATCGNIHTCGYHASGYYVWSYDPNQGYGFWPYIHFDCW